MSSTPLAPSAEAEGKIAAFATDPALVVKYSGQFVEMQYDYPPLLRKIQDVVEARLGISFNHCMLNNYEDGTPSLSFSERPNLTASRSQARSTSASIETTEKTGPSLLPRSLPDSSSTA